MGLYLQWCWIIEISQSINVKPIQLMIHRIENTSKGQVYKNHVFIPIWRVNLHGKRL